MALNERNSSPHALDDAVGCVLQSILAEITYRVLTEVVNDGSTSATNQIRVAGRGEGSHGNQARFHKKSQSTARGDASKGRIRGLGAHKTGNQSSYLYADKKPFSPIFSTR